MIIISEKLNSSIPSSLKLMENGTDEEIRKFIALQWESGAEYLDLNAAMCADEKETAKRIAEITENSFIQFMSRTVAVVAEKKVAR